MGHTVKRIAPQFVKPYVKGNKNVAAVALANKTMRMAWTILHGGGDYQPDDHRAKAQPV